MNKNIIIDNGSYNVKIGTVNHESPQIVPNCVVRTNDKRIHLGSKLTSEKTIKDLASNTGNLTNLSFHRPHKNGQLFQWNLQHQIWDNLFVDLKLDSGNGDFLKDSNLLFVESSFSLPKFQNMTDQVLFEEYGIQNLVRYSSAALMPWLDDDLSNTVSNNNNNDNDYKNFQLVIDAGFEATWIVPMINGIPYNKAIRKLPIGGRFLNSYLREIISFRHYNIVEEPVLVNSIKEKTCYVAYDYNDSLNKITRLKKNPSQMINSDMSLTYILPNNKTDFFGYPVSDESQLSKAELYNLRKSLERSNSANSDSDNENDELSNSQSLLLTDERFLIPETLFHPQLSGIYKCGLIETVKSSLDAVPELLRPLLSNNIVTVGGTSNLSGFQERIQKDLNPEIPIEAKVNILNYSKVSSDKSVLPWHAGKSFFEKGGFEKVMISKDEYMEFGAEYAQEKFGFKL